MLRLCVFFFMSCLACLPAFHLDLNCSLLTVYLNSALLNNVHAMQSILRAFTCTHPVCTMANPQPFTVSLSDYFDIEAPDVPTPAPTGNNNAFSTHPQTYFLTPSHVSAGAIDDLSPHPVVPGHDKPPFANQSLEWESVVVTSPPPVLNILVSPFFRVSSRMWTATDHTAWTKLQPNDNKNPRGVRPTGLRRKDLAMLTASLSSGTESTTSVNDQKKGCEMITHTLQGKKMGRSLTSN